MQNIRTVAVTTIFLSLALAFVSIACAQSGNTTGETVNQTEPLWNVLTPETVSHKGFEFEIRFKDNTVTSGGATNRTGVVSVQIIFDAAKGPKIKEIHSAHLRVRDGEKILVYVPIETAKHRETNDIHWAQFSLHDETISKSDVMLSFIDGIHSFYYEIPLDEFYDQHQAK